AAQEARLTETGTILGTAAYAAPEQFAAGDVTPAADVYALGACLYEALTGRPKQLEEPIAPVRELAPDVSEAVEDLVMRCLARNPAYRPTAAELAAALGQAPEPTSAPTVPLRPRRRERRALWAAPPGP